MNELQLAQKPLLVWFSLEVILLKGCGGAKNADSTIFENLAKKGLIYALTARRAPLEVVHGYS